MSEEVFQAGFLGFGIQQVAADQREANVTLDLPGKPRIHLEDGRLQAFGEIVALRVAQTCIHIPIIGNLRSKIEGRLIVWRTVTEFVDGELNRVANERIGRIDE